MQITLDLNEQEILLIKFAIAKRIKEDCIPLMFKDSSGKAEEKLQIWENILHKVEQVEKTLAERGD